MKYTKSTVSKEEREVKVEEMRNKVAKKMNSWADRIQVSMAFEPTIKRFEGESWIENGKTWTLKNGVKQSVSSLQEARMPWWCPKCTKPMNHRFDRKFYYLRGFCYNCNIDFEGDLRVRGEWEEYEAQIIRANEISWLKDKIQELTDSVTNFKEPTIMFETGETMKLAGKAQFAEMLEKMEKDIEFCLGRLEFLRLNPITPSQTEESNVTDQTESTV